jgi:tetraprenyl-beta-curcumene synthase
MSRPLPSSSPRAFQSGSHHGFHRRGLAARAWVALLLANARYWSTVAPLVRAQLARWEQRAEAIPDPAPRRLATCKLRQERFNSELAATLATLAPRAQRGLAVEAIVALQVAYDYLDVLGERSLLPISPGRRDVTRCGIEDGYLCELTATVEDALARLPAARAVGATARRAAERCARAQALSHAASSSGDEELRQWARDEAEGTALGWPEWLAGAQASVLCLHALIAAAADPRATPRDAEQLDALYLSIGALTMLDSLVDRAEDAAAGERGYIRFYEGPEQMALALSSAAREAARRTSATPHPGHHAMTLAGVVAYYASAPAAASASALPVVKRVCGELGALMVPTLALMRSWRLAKRLHGRMRS